MLSRMANYAHREIAFPKELLFTVDFFNKLLYVLYDNVCIETKNKSWYTSQLKLIRSIAECLYWT